MEGKRRHDVYLVLFLIAIFLAGGIPAFAEENVQDLKAQIQALQKRVEELEASNVQPQQEKDRDVWNNPWDPFSEIERMQEQMNRMFQSSFGRSGLHRGIFHNDMSFDYDFDIQEKEDRYEIIFDTTGWDEKNLDIEINKDSITVKGQHSVEQKEERENSFFNSKSYGTFLRTIPVPVDADTARAKTEKKGKMLIITLPKLEV